MVGAKIGDGDDPASFAIKVALIGQSVDTLNKNVEDFKTETRAGQARLEIAIQTLDIIGRREFEQALGEGDKEHRSLAGRLNGLQEQVSTVEKKIDDKLSSISAKLDARAQILDEKIDALSSKTDGSVIKIAGWIITFLLSSIIAYGLGTGHLFHK